ncbi:hypothetical protein N7478_005733 [Penicillium angulare]|uniref:uncharacterized protein n=1 Tax=Penicillium angulare TaxID=116970 RepID=UPI00253F6719|nr:uncharacterized protein N7478_005733 [Penicillium angulare]KAJ5280361.1 hypothetical protein N7478_005733 [Penicillium angulare]
MSGAADKSLLERVEFPTIPAEAQRQIAHLQEEFMRAEVEKLRQSIPLQSPLFKKREEIVSGNPKVQEEFWGRVFAAAPQEIDDYILPGDIAVIGEALSDFKVERFECNEKGEGEPRSLRFTFTFKTGEENPYLENEKLVKEFYWRKHIVRTSSGKRRTWEGLVSDPVRINWKKDQDVTKGLLDATCDLFDAEKKKGGERSKLPEYEALVHKLEELEAEAMAHDHDHGEDEECDDDEEFTSPSGNSFFNWFGYRGRDVTAAQSKEAEKEDEERWVKISKGEKVEEDDEEDDDDEDIDELVDDLEEAEAFPDGDELAFAFADDLWTDAMKYYIQSFELGDDLDELDLDELNADMMEEDSDEDEEEDAKSHPRKKVRT